MCKDVNHISNKYKRKKINYSGLYKMIFAVCFKFAKEALIHRFIPSRHNKKNMLIRRTGLFLSIYYYRQIHPKKPSGKV